MVMSHPRPRLRVCGSHPDRPRCLTPAVSCLAGPSRCPSPSAPSCERRAASRRPGRTAPTRPIFGLGCFWGAEKAFWSLPGVVIDGGRLRRRLHAQPHVRGGLLAAGPATPRSVLVAFDPARIAYEQLLKVFWEHHDPTQGMRQGNDVGTQYRSAIYSSTTPSSGRAEASRDAYQAALTAAGYGPITTEIGRRRPVLLRRGLSPAVPGQEPRRLLPGPLHRREAAGRLRGYAAPVRRSSPVSGDGRRLALESGDDRPTDGQCPPRCRRPRGCHRVLCRTWSGA